MGRAEVLFARESIPIVTCSAASNLDDLLYLRGVDVIWDM